MAKSKTARIPSGRNVRVIDHVVNGQPGAAPVALSPYFLASRGQPPASDFPIHDDRNFYVERGELRRLKAETGMTYEAMSTLIGEPTAKLRRWLAPGKSDGDLLPANKFSVRVALLGAS